MTPVSSDGLRPADRRILEYLDSNPPDYIPLIANRLGLPLGYANDRRDVLVEQGMMRPVTNEAIYQLTEQGEQYLAETARAVQPTDD